MRGRMIGFTLRLGGILLLTATWGQLASPPAAEAQTVTRGVLQPQSLAGDVPAPQLSPREREALLLRKLKLRKQMAAHENTNPPSPPGLPLVPGRQTQVINPDVGARFIGTPSQLVIGRNNKNTNATIIPNSSTLAEPAAANNGRLVFAAGNFDHAEISTDAGVTWTDVPLPGGPLDAPFLCCDQDVVIDDARRVVFHSYLYINGTNPPSNGVVRIDVLRSIAGPGQPACFFLIDPAGTNNNILPDFPHLGLTKNFLWLATNDIGSTLPGGQRARMYRFNMDQMADCVATTVSTFDWPSTTEGQRVWRPVEGANAKETMYWMHLANTTTARIFSWPETAASPTNFLRTISPSTFGDPDCRGGVGDFDWIDDVSAGIFGFGNRGAVGHDRVSWYWQVAPDTALNHNQGHIHAAVFSLGSFTLLAQPHIFNTNFCYGNPNVSANKEGDLGISLSFGGKAGGGGAAAQSAVGIDDDFTAGIGVFSLVLTATGTHNRSDSRFGDYFTIHPYEPCEKWFTATNYALLSGTDASNVNSRYVEFGRRRSFRCYDAYRNQFPESLTAPR